MVQNWSTKSISHNKELPLTNYICLRRKIQQDNEQLQKSLRAVKSSNYHKRNQPRIFPHLQYNAKKEALKMDAQMRISKDNRNLLVKLEKTKVRKKRGYQAPIVAGTFIDSHQIPRIDNQNCNLLKHTTSHMRSRERTRIAQENQKMNKRISEQKSFYSNKKLIQKREEEEKFLYRHRDPRLRNYGSPTASTAENPLSATKKALIGNLTLTKANELRIEETLRVKPQLQELNKNFFCIGGFPTSPQKAKSSRKKKPQLKHRFIRPIPSTNEEEAPRKDTSQESQTSCHVLNERQKVLSSEEAKMNLNTADRKCLASDDIDATEIASCSADEIQRPTTNLLEAPRSSTTHLLTQQLILDWCSVAVSRAAEKKSRYQ